MSKVERGMGVTEKTGRVFELCHDPCSPGRYSRVMGSGNTVFAKKDAYLAELCLCGHLGRRASACPRGHTAPRPSLAARLRPVSLHAPQSFTLCRVFGCGPRLRGANQHPLLNDPQLQTTLRLKPIPFQKRGRGPHD